jgi:hypothetical protein
MKKNSWVLLEKVFTAETLMTPLNNLLVWQRGLEDKAKTCCIAREESYDAVPIKEDNQIIGLILSKTEEEIDLDTSWLVSRDSSVPDLINCFLRSGKPALLLFHRQDVTGLVTPADLNKIEARTYFYNLIGEMEISIAKYLRSRGDVKTVMIKDQMGERQLKRAEKLEMSDVNIDLIQLLYLSQLMELVKLKELAYQTLGFSNSADMNSAFNDLNDFRTRTMHPVKPMLENIKTELPRLKKRLKMADQIINYLSTAK